MLKVEMKLQVKKTFGVQLITYIFCNEEGRKWQKTTSLRTYEVTHLKKIDEPTLFKVYK